MFVASIRAKIALERGTWIKVWYSVKARGEEIKMTPCEYKLLLFFIGSAEMALMRQIILASVWSYAEDTNTRTLDAHVSKLRNKCEPDPSMPRHFVTVHGVGYRFLM